MVLNNMTTLTGYQHSIWVMFSAYALGNVCIKQQTGGKYDLHCVKSSGYWCWCNNVGNVFLVHIGLFYNSKFSVPQWLPQSSNRAFGMLLFGSRRFAAGMFRYNPQQLCDAIMLIYTIISNDFFSITLWNPCHETLELFRSGVSSGTTRFYYGVPNAVAGEGTSEYPAYKIMLH